MRFVDKQAYQVHKYLSRLLSIWAAKEFSGLPELRRQNLDSRKPMDAEVHRRNLREERDTERKKNQVSIEDSVDC